MDFLLFEDVTDFRCKLADFRYKLIEHCPNNAIVQIAGV